MQMSNSYKGLLVFIPTRNRADFAVAAIQSVLNQPVEKLTVVVSDNSTVVEDVERLANFCSRLDDDRLHYIRPDEPLPMPAHFDWIMQRCIQLSDVNHFTCLTDRMLFKPRELIFLSKLAEAYPEKIISYNHDRVVDDASPVRVELDPWTGKTFDVSTEHLLSLVSHLAIHATFLPRMLNCIMPRGLLQGMLSRFGNIVGSSTSPDFHFCFRCFAMVESIICYDKSPLLQYGLYRSNGHTMSKGVASSDYVDYLKNLGERQLYYAAPVPKVATVRNAIAHEYCAVQQETNSPKFPELDIICYLKILSGEVKEIENLEVRHEMQHLLEAHSSYETAMMPSPEIENSSQGKTLLIQRLRPARVVKGIRSRINRLFNLPPSEPFHPTFTDAKDAVEHACLNPLPQQMHVPEYLRPFLAGAREVEIPAPAAEVAEQKVYQTS